MDINVVLFLSYACVNMNYLRNVGDFFNRALNCNV